MDTPELSPSPSTMHVSDALPWLADEPLQPVVPRPQARAARPARGPDMVHWWVVALTVLTATSVLFGAHGGTSRSRELLPIVMIAG